MTNSITTNAIRALLYEVVTEPKPGLVNPASPGPHPDMDIYTFIDSSLSLESYFAAAVQIGQNFSATDLTKMFQQLRKRGIVAEKEMFTATHGVNTHKGAIFALGICACAESYSAVNNTELFLTITQMCRGLVHHDLVENNQLQTAGEKEFIQYQIGGARAQAEQGYPVVREVALPFLKNSTGTLQARLIDTLIKIAAVSVDSNLIKRAGNYSVIKWLHAGATKYLALGGYQTLAGRKQLQKLCQDCLTHNYSLGGCADLLIVTIFVALQRGYI